jgi:cyclase
MRTAARFERGLQEVADGVFAYLQPDGSWGWANAGLVIDGGSSLLVDTLYGNAQTRTMLEEMARLSPAARAIDVVVNTHANGDHCWGNQLVPTEEILATRRAAEEMRLLQPRQQAMLVNASKLASRGGWPAKMLMRGLGHLGLRRLGAVGVAADFVTEIFGDFDFDGITITPPTKTFTGEHTLRVGDTPAVCIEVGPAHTTGDAIVHLPEQRVVFTGDILFAGAHPIMWEGPVDNWIAACDRIVAMDVDVVVPGHGPVSDETAIEALGGYLRYLRDEAHARQDAGMSSLDAALDIDLSDYADWGEPERIVVNVDALFAERRGESKRDPVVMFELMARFRARR